VKDLRLRAQSRITTATPNTQAMHRKKLPTRIQSFRKIRQDDWFFI
jgi:hypothetical protein